MSFTHLHVHSEYSLVDGLARIPDLIDDAVEKGFESIALTDLHNIFATVKFYDYAVQKGIKPIIGCELNLEISGQNKRDCRIVLLCMNQTGYRNLLDLLTRSYQKMESRKAKICYEWLTEYNEGLIALSGGSHGDIGQALLMNRLSQVRQLAQFWREHFPDRYYIEIFRTNRETDDAYVERAIDFAAREKLPLVATNDVCFLNEAQFHPHEVRVCISAGSILNDASREARYSAVQYLKREEEMRALFHDALPALENAAEIAKRCTVFIKTGKIFFPKFLLTQGRTSDAELNQKATLGLEKILVQMPPNIDRQTYHSRLNMELKVIHQVGYADYFLIVADIVAWAKQNGIAVGPGRGSGAGSLVAYALGITAIDPLRYDLLFERFLNPERVTMPDFDIDLCVEGRDRVIEYVADRYGRDKVSQIITFGSMTAKAVIRDVGRVMGKPYGYVDELAKLIPNDLNITLDDALKKSPDLKERYENDPDVTQIIDTCEELEGLSRNPGTHAGGVVIAPKALTEYTALYCDTAATNVVTHFDMQDLEKIGLVKFDFLGLKTLTIIDKTMRRINQQNAIKGTAKLTLQDIPLDDPLPFQLLCNANTTAVFQLESEGIRQLMSRLRPDKFEDIVALIALYRPGPLQSGMVDDYIKRKHGAVVEHLHPQVVSILKPTYGVIVYQEQVMQIARELAGYTLGSADLLRRAMGKKLQVEMAKQRQVFVTNACDRGTKRDVAIYIFDLIEKFAGYGFNRSHSVAYALLAYQTAWLKSHYPTAFMSAVLSSEMSNTDKIVDLIYESRAMGLKVLPPDVNQSVWEFQTENTDKIRYGLGAVRNLGEKMMRLLEQERKIGEFTSANDFCRRMVPHQMKQNVLEILIGVGALDCFGKRNELLENAARTYSMAENYFKDQQVGQGNLFEIESNGIAKSTTVTITQSNCRRYDDQKLLTLEFENLGTYFSEHPLNRHRDEIDQILKLSDVANDTEVTNSYHGGRRKSAYFTGVIAKMAQQRSRRGRGLRFLLDDSKSRQEFLLYDESYKKYSDKLQKGRIVVVKAKSFYDAVREVQRWKVQVVYSLDELRAVSARVVVLDMDLDLTRKDFVNRMREKLEPFVSDQGCVVKLSIWNIEASAILVLDQTWKVKPCENLLNALRMIEGVRKVQIFY